jgi:hypothetical protein
MPCVALEGIIDRLGSTFAWLAQSMLFRKAGERQGR